MSCGTGAGRTPPDDGGIAPIARSPGSRSSAGAPSGRSNVASRAPIASSTRFAIHVDGTLFAMMLNARRSPFAAVT